MKRLLLGAVLLTACSSSSSGSDTPSDSQGGSANGGSGATAGTSASGATGGNAPGTGGSNAAGSGGSGTAGSGGSAAGTSSAGAGGSGGAESGGAAGASGAENQCSAARAQLLGSVDSVATGNVTVLGTTSGVTSLYVDASAGGIASETTNPWIFVDLGAGAKVPVTDVSSQTSAAWDLAVKRPVLYTNDGNGGPGQGGAVLLAKDFGAVTADDATGVIFGTEAFFDAQCNPNLDPAGSALTTFSTWYDYDPSTHILSPATGTWLVRGGTGKLYKLAIETYYANPDGSVGTGDGGTYALKVEAL